MKKFIIVLISLSFIFVGSAFAGKRVHPQLNRHGNQTRVERRPNYQSNSRFHQKYHNYKYYRHYTWREWRNDRRYYHRKHGTYHNDGSNKLFFSFCERGNCFTISIGD